MNVHKTINEFQKQLEDACSSDDADSKKAFSDLAPQMAAALKKTHDWDAPTIPIDSPPETISIISGQLPTSIPTPVDFNALIHSILGPIPPQTTSTELSNADMHEAYANIITCFT